TPPGGASASTSTSNSTRASYTIVPAPIATADQHVCYICLQTDADNPGATFVNPCPCSLEAHEECMLRFIAETEQQKRSGRSKGAMRCPACKEPIYVDEPYDAFLALRDNLYRRYSGLSPLVLVTIFGCGSIAGSAWYGWSAAQTFAGPEAIERWMAGGVGGLTLMGGPRKYMSLLPKILTLAAIGPTLVVTRAIPSLGHIFFVPASFFYALTLVARDEVLTWPPSPEWTVALMPYVHLSYNFFYYDFLGPLEMRLNRALRGRPPVEEPPAALENEAAEAAAVAPAPVGEAAEDEEPGLWNSVVNLGQLVLRMFGDGPMEVELQIRGGDGDENDEGDDGAPEPAHQQNPPPLPDRAAAPPPPPPPPPEPAPNQNQNQGRNQNGGAAADENRVNGTLTTILNSIMTSLLFPAFSYGMGELLSLAVPRAWVTRPAPPPSSSSIFLRRGSPLLTSPTGLLQQPWGRSLVGGCLFVVLRDAFALYVKYRRVQVKLNRKVRNVEK
ncbi:hypothetical protein B0T26DRAFT_619235, partial [Lasiosphaeria miniovina]